MKLSIITVNYNSSDRTVQLLRSLSEQTDRNFQIIVVDNASEEADFSNLKGAIGGAMLIRNTQNLGFSGGNNVGIKKALDPLAGGGTEWVVLLNNDTYVENGFIVSLKAKLSQLEGIVGIPLNEGDYTAYCGRVEWLKPTLNHIHNPLYSENLASNSSYYGIGGAVAIRRDVFSVIGLLDEKYFLYFEDADFSIAAQRAGLKLTFLEEPKVEHQVSSTIKKLGSSLLLRYHYRNALYFNFKNGPWYIKLAIWPWSFWIMKKQILKIILRYKPDESAAILKGVFDFYHHRMGKI